jgi:hypothetical protein
VIYEHAQDVIPAQSDLVKHLNQASELGWELLTLTVGQGQPSIITPQTPAGVMPVLILVFRRPRPEPAAEPAKPLGELISGIMRGSKA